MNIKYYKEYSHYLDRDMEFKVYGHGGQAILVFPSQDGRFYDFENFKMVDTVSDLIEDGKVQLFCCDSIDKESWSANDKNPHDRILVHESWFNYIVNELVPRIHQINEEIGSHHLSNGIFTTGCSLGGLHAANFLFRRPDIFKGILSMSGYFDSDLFFDDYCDELIVKNSPIKFIKAMSYDDPMIEKYRKCKIILCCGQGEWESPGVRSINELSELLNNKNIPVTVDLWGHDVYHDWHWWRIQFPYFLKQML